MSATRSIACVPSGRIEAGPAFRVSGFPTLLLLDPDGIVLETRSNQLRGDKLIPTLERFMKQHK
ncbi:MAG: hypothetical protein M3468_14690 [Acidobacteriota bacterium]|nr:hypothetical protein [Acidobacteriota bacterium]